MSSLFEAVNTAATVAAAAVAICVLGTWRDQMVAERKANVA